jgi:hypothetical protein
MQTVPTGWEREFTQTLMNYCYAEVTLHLGNNDTLTFTKADMTSFEVSQSVSPINAELPQSSLRFSITTIGRDVRALQRSLTRMLKVTARVGITINGEPAYINAGTFWLDTWDFPNGGIEASFEARDALYFLSSEKYIYGVYRRNGISLYDLADEVLTYAQGRFPCVTTWSINNVLSSSNTTAPLPVCTYAECLQYIAQASGTVLKYDRDGVIRFDLTSGDTSYNYIVTDTNCFAYPQLVMYPELRKLRCNVYTYSLDEIYSDTEHYPNVNGDATVSAVDAALVLSAAAKIGAGEPSGLTPEQEVKADADRDGMITAADAALIQEYAAKCGSGKYENSPDGWALFLNIKIGYKEKVYDSIHNIDEDMELVITYGTSAEVNVMKEGTITITNVDDYSNAAEIAITGTDEDAQITAYGFPIEVSTHEYRRDVNESGDDEYIDNPLVTNNTTAGSATQDVKDFLSIRNGVECSDFRIDPRLDAGDTITVNIDGEDTTYGNTIVTDVKYRFTGMFRGSISGRINIPEPEPTYDETKIAVIELDENYEPTDVVTYYTDISEAMSAIKNGSADLYWLYVGTESGASYTPSGALAGSTKLGKFRRGSINNINAGTFYGNTSLKQIDLSGGTFETIGQSAFEGCSNIDTLIGDIDVQYLNQKAFYGCSSIAFGDLAFGRENSIESIQSNAFYGCNGIETLTIETTNANGIMIDDSAFENCLNLTEVNINCVGRVHFYSRVFANCSALKTVTISGGEYGAWRSNVFTGCDGITITINAPENSISGAPWGATNAEIIWTG